MSSRACGRSSTSGPRWARPSRPAESSAGRSRPVGAPPLEAGGARALGPAGARAGDTAARSLAAPRFRPPPHLPSRTHVLPLFQPPDGRAQVAPRRPARRRPDRGLRHARERHQRARPLVARRFSASQRVPARSPRRSRVTPAPHALAPSWAARAPRCGSRAGPRLPRAPCGAPAAPQRASLSALTGLGGPQPAIPPPPNRRPCGTAHGRFAGAERGPGVAPGPAAPRLARASYSTPGSPRYDHGRA
jgi:hypothetical protein